VFRVAFNWDEFVLFDRSARSVADGVLRGGGHGGLSELILAPLVAECADEVSVGQHARLLWLGFFITYLAGVGALLWELLRDRAHRLHDTALGVAALAWLPVLLEWSLQVRSDHIAAAGGAWGGALLLMSRRRIGWAALAGVAFGVGWLSSQKLAYLALLMLCVEVGTLLLTRDWKPRRDAMRAALLAASVLAVTSAYRFIISGIFSVPASHPTSPVPETAWVTSYLDIFDFYRHTLGYDQHLAVLPTLIPHALVFVGLAFASFSQLRERRLDVRVALAWGSLALGIAVALFHAAAFSYFWITLGTFLVVASTLALGPAREQLPHSYRAFATALLWCAIAWPGAVHSFSLLEDTQGVQRESLRFVANNFRSQDPGFHPEAGVFCSPQPMGTWLSQSIYQRVGAPDARPNIPRVIERFKQARIHYLVDSFRLNQFPPEIRDFFSDHYQPYRASVYVAGKRLQGKAGESVDFDLILPGLYRWLPYEGPHSIRIDGQQLEPGATLALDATLHRANFDGPEMGGALVLAVREPPGPAPISFYKRY
jgi:hypothetical protein